MINGKEIFRFNGEIDITANNGQGGHWLIDPNNITIVAAGAGPTADITQTGTDFTTDEIGAILEVNDIEAVLTGNATVTITTGTAGLDTDAGNITLNTAPDFDDGGSAGGSRYQYQWYDFRYFYRRRFY